MNYRNLMNDTWTYNENIRAEDGPQPQTGWRALLDSLLIPIGFIVLLVLIYLLMSQSASAQTGSGRIAGTGKDAIGTLISSSEVALVNIANGVKQKTVCDGEGVFNFAVVLIGQYELDVTRPALRRTSRPTRSRSTSIRH